jgi:hypothetical protein
VNSTKIKKIKSEKFPTSVPMYDHRREVHMIQHDISLDTENLRTIQLMIFGCSIPSFSTFLQITFPLQSHDQKTNKYKRWGSNTS